MANFLFSVRNQRFFASNHTCCPLMNGLKPQLNLSTILCLANSWAARASSWALVRKNSLSSAAEIFDGSMTAGMAQELKPIMRKKGDAFLVADVLWLCMNSMSVRCDTQSSGCAAQKIQRYTSIS